MILLLLAGCGQEYPTMPILGIPGWTCHRRKKTEREGEGKMLGRHFIWLKEDLEAVRENIADDGHCNTGIRKVDQIITKPNKPNGVRTYSSSLLYTIITHNHLPFFKNFQILYIFAKIFKYCSLFQHFFALFLKNHSACLTF